MAINRWASFCLLRYQCSGHKLVVDCPCLAFEISATVRIRGDDLSNIVQAIRTAIFFFLFFLKSDILPSQRLKTLNTSLEKVLLLDLPPSEPLEKSDQWESPPRIESAPAACV